MYYEFYHTDRDGGYVYFQSSEFTRSEIEQWFTERNNGQEIGEVFCECCGESSRLTLVDEMSTYNSEKNILMMRADFEKLKKFNKMF